MITISFLIWCLVFLLIVAVVLYCVRALLGAWSVPNPIATTVYVIVVLIFLLLFLQHSGVLTR